MKRRNRSTWKTICFFVIIANLPFLTMVHLMGIEVFLASFHHPDTYQAIKIQNGTMSGGYLLLEIPTSNEFLVHDGDTILYRNGEGAVRCEPVLSVEQRHGTVVYYTTMSTQDNVEGPIFDTQVLGKVTGTIEDNLWNSLCLRLWDFTVQHLNIYHLF